MKNAHSGRSPWKGAVAGLIAGVVASWMMDQFQYLWLSMPAGKRSATPGVESNKPGTASEDANRANDEAEDDATKKAASAISERVFGHKLTPEEKAIAGPVVHYAVGAAAGLAYGVASEFLPQVTAGYGLPYGAVFWLTVDEGAVPLLGLSKGPTAYPVSTHAYAAASHLVFGFAAELTRRAIYISL
jgi:hypothetical protein